MNTVTAELFLAHTNRRWVRVNTERTSSFELTRILEEFA